MSASKEMSGEARVFARAGAIHQKLAPILHVWGPVRPGGSSVGGFHSPTLKTWVHWPGLTDLPVPSQRS